MGPRRGAALSPRRVGIGTGLHCLDGVSVDPECCGTSPGLWGHGDVGDEQGTAGVTIQPGAEHDRGETLAECA